MQIEDYLTDCFGNARRLQRCTQNKRFFGQIQSPQHSGVIGLKRWIVRKLPPVLVLVDKNAIACVSQATIFQRRCLCLTGDDVLTILLVSGSVCCQ